MLPKNSPARVDYNNFRDRFGRDDLVVATFSTENIFDLKFLAQLKTFHTKLETIPHVSEVTSLINARHTEGRQDELVVEDLFENWPQDEKDLKQIKTKVRSNPIYQNFLVDEKERYTSVLIQIDHYEVSQVSDDEVLMGFGDDTSDTEAKIPLSDSKRVKTVNQIRQEVESLKKQDIKIHIAGTPVLVETVKGSMQKEMQTFVLFALILIALCLWVLFRSLLGVVLPLFVVVLSLLSCLSLMALTQTPIMITTQILPSFLLAVGVGDALHILAIYQQKLKTAVNKTEAIVASMNHCTLAILMTSVTTACGLFSFLGAPLAPISSLGLFAGIGVLIAFVLSVVLLPTLLAIFPSESFKSQKKSHVYLTQIMEKVLSSLSLTSYRHPKIILTTVILMLTAALMGVRHIKFSHNPMDWLPNHSLIKKDTQVIDQNMGGSASLEIMFSSPEKDSLKDPQTLNQIADIMTELETIKVIPEQTRNNKSLGLPDIIKETHKALNEGKKEFYTIPQDKKLLTQEIFLFENSGSDDLEDIVNKDFNETRVTLRVPWNDAIKFANFNEKAKKIVTEKKPQGFTVKLTGLLSILTHSIKAVINSMTQSYLIAALVISFLMLFLLGGSLGLLSLIPNFTPIVCTLGLMGWYGISINAFTLMIASIAMGLAVDDTIHFFHTLKKELQKNTNLEDCIQRTVMTTGRALFMTTVVLSLGFSSFMLSDMTNLVEFGFLTAFTIVLAFLADMVLSPALLSLYYRKQKKSS